MEKILIITGGNKGIGSGIIKAYQQHSFRIFSISRTKNITEAYKNITQIEFDLSETTLIKQMLDDLFEHLNINNISNITLINNAGTLGEINKTERINSDDIAKTIQLNATAPLILSANFLRLTAGLPCQKTIVNISSGAATKPYSGWTVYCATKAALDMMTKTMALEQDEVESGAKVLAIYPGVVDTDMQTTIRSSNKENFTAIDRFLELKQTNALADAEKVGRQIFNLANDESITNGAIIRVEE